MTISKSMKFAAVRSFAKVVISEAGKGQTIAALVEDFNATAMMHGFDFLMIAKPGRVAKLVELMEHVISRMDAMPEYAEPVPEVSDKQAADHLVHAGWMKGQLVAHGIDPQDFEAAIAWCVGNGNIVPRYWISIYVDYVYQVTPFCPDEGCPHSDTVHYCNTLPSQAPLWDCPKAGRVHYFDMLPPLGRAVPDASPLVVTSKQAKWLRDQGYGGDLEVVDFFPDAQRTVRVNMSDRDVVTLTADNPADANTARVLQDVINHGIGAFSADLAAGLTMHHALENVIQGWRPMTDQESRAAFNYQDQLKLNKFPRGKCARRMLTLGWHFNED